MSKDFSAKIEWIPHNEGGRKKYPPKETRYCPMINVDDVTSWSIDFICPDFSETDFISFRFLVDEAPNDAITMGAKYDLYEGGKRVAVITIY